MSENSKFPTRLGLDIGTNSIGWWLYRTDGNCITEVIDGGVRIFSDGRKSGPDWKRRPSLAVDWRMARSARRMRDRYLRRRTSLMRKLSEAGLMPINPDVAKTLELLDPYELRARGLNEALPLPYLGRALFHLNQRRGFKSNRKIDRGDNESGKIKDATARLDQAMMIKYARTYGEFLHMCRSDKPGKPGNKQKTNKDGSCLDHLRTKPVRTRLTLAQRDDSGEKKEGYDFYPDRRHLEEEFETLWKAQSAFHPDVLTDDLKKALFETIFHQRPLRDPEIGLCLFSGQHDVPSDEKRLPKAHPLTQRRVLFETVNNLRITADGREKRSLTLEQRDQIIHALDNRKATKDLKSMELSFNALGKVIKLAPYEYFTLETATRDAIACDLVRASLSHPDRFGPNWSTLDPDAQWEVIRRIRRVQSDADHEVLRAWLIKTHELDGDHAWATATAPLPEGFGRLGETASRKILDVLKVKVVTYDKAVAACGWHHSDHRTGEVLDQLPYYGAILQRHVIPGSARPEDDDITRFGRITNPTVHIGLNQLRRLVNKIIDVHGKPDQIVVELARDLKQSEKKKLDVQKRIKNNTDAARKRSKQLADLGQRDTGHNRMLLRLYEDLGPVLGTRCCPYTGKPISVTMLFDGSCDVDHILPYSRTMDDSFANRTLCLRQANREKTNKTPWEIWGETSQWDNIVANLKNLPDNKRWRFAPDAMERFEGENDFLDRALVDTQYLSKIARTYLDTLYTKDGHVWVVPGRLTEKLRRHWGLNSLLPDHNKGTAKVKNRTDHRHHAIDAAVIAATDPGLIQRISKAAGRDEGNGLGAEEVARTIPEPWEGFRTDIGTQLNRIVVSHRANHGRIDPEAKKQGRDSTTGQLHNDTAYGIVDEQKVVSRIPFSDLKVNDINESSKGKYIRDPYLRNLLAEATAGKEIPKGFEAALAEFVASEYLPNGKYNPYLGTRHVRLVDEQRVVSCIPLLSLTADNIAETLKWKSIRDTYLQEFLADAIVGKDTPKEIEAALAEFAASEHLPNGKYNPYRGIRHVRLIQNLQSSARIEIKNKDGKPYKAFKGDSNHCYDIWRMPDGKFKAQVITSFEAHNEFIHRRPHSAAKLLLRVFKRDMVAIERDGKTLICYVQSMHVKNGLCLVPHIEANADARSRSKNDPFRFIQMRADPLMKAEVRRILVDETGRFRDPRPNHLIK